MSVPVQVGTVGESSPSFDAEMAEPPRLFLRAAKITHAVAPIIIEDRIVQSGGLNPRNDDPPPGLLLVDANTTIAVFAGPSTLSDPVVTFDRNPGGIPIT